MFLLEVQDLVRHFPVRSGILNRVVGAVQAVSGVSFGIAKGETVGVIGESGCGKSTLAKAIVRLQEPTQGRVIFDGCEITRLSHSEMMPYRRRMQFIFQDPYSSLNPRMTAGQMLAEVIRFHRIVPAREADAYIDELLRLVQLRKEARHRYPHEFSGGQRQRLNIARALAVRPELIVADEPVSALDVSVQAQILNLLMDLREQFGLTMIFISHDLRVVQHFCDRMMVMYLGHVVETLPCDTIFESARHPYTQALLKSNPLADPDVACEPYVLAGEVPNPRNPPAGCPFVTRCPVAEPRCALQRPELLPLSASHQVACWAVHDPPRNAAAEASQPVNS